MTRIACPQCKLRLTMKGTDFPLYCCCGGVWRSIDEVEIVTPTAVEVSLRIKPSIKVAVDRRHTKRDDPERTDDEVLRIISEFCEKCEVYTKSGVCSADPVCRHCTGKSRWRSRMKRLIYSCPQRKWPAVARRVNRHEYDLPVRIAFVTPGLDLGGAERWVQTLAASLDPAVVMPVVVLLSNPRAYVDTVLVRAIGTTCPVLTLGDNCGAVLGCDLVVMWGSGRLPKPVEDFAGTLVYVHHSSTEKSRLMARQASVNAQHVVAVSESAAAACCDSGKGCTVIRNGVELSRLSERRVNHRDDPTILYVGRANLDKRPDLAARAAAYLGPPWRVRFVGGFVAQQRRELTGLCGRAEFTGPVEDVGSQLATADALLLASRHEAMSLTLLEAWAAGLPTVTTPVGAVPELERDHGQMTMLIPVDAGPEAAGAAILGAISPYNTGTVARARAVVRQHYSAEAMARRWTTFLLAAATYDRLA